MNSCERRFYHYEQWEEYQSGMWSRVYGKKRLELLAQAIQFTGDHELYGSWMMKVLDSWPISCAQNLPDLSQNRKAWIGHAATCLAIQCPEDITREAWWNLTLQQQYDANARAADAIAEWENRQQRDYQMELFYA